MNEELRVDACRRRWLAHCSVLAAAASGMPWMAAHAAPAKPAKILVVGDSLSAEYGIKRGSGWVSLLTRRLDEEKLGAAVVNASVSGDTTSGGRSRLPGLLSRHQPTHVVLELGANDALRGLPLAMTQANLSAMAQEAKAAGARVLIVGMQLPPNYGRKYSDDFAAVFASVAKSEGAALVPFMLKGVADVPEAETMFQPDRIHPLAQAHPLILANIWPMLAPMLR